MDRRIIKTKASIKQAMLVCLASHYFSEITIEAICKEAQCSRSTFYAHYDNKEEVIDAISKEIIEQIRPYMKQTFDEPKAFLSIITSLTNQIYQPRKDVIKFLMDPEFRDFGLEAHLLILFEEQFLQRFSHIKGKAILAEIYAACVLCNIKSIIENRSTKEDQEAIGALKNILFQSLQEQEKNQVRKS
ncbi:TetR/AcrR family transcriptional regulator [Streptococcus macacae]|uniref:Transcriptional regulator, TetR family n=1 Tax=Streptococcus macacae NCTC 11558 TaxID=764298 RepID=G5JUU7_9STRE|nr:TetR/AcrR family transcriptional regulator [Streptococcus macacae]EHJ52602.1 transcriptional regulator, TetR family [Streptococcus macacae NCTC 11558]SUN78911.1 transcriptional regulator [Streptococcus macacae NCTC 11558]